MFVLNNKLLMVAVLLLPLLIVVAGWSARWWRRQGPGSRRSLARRGRQAFASDEPLSSGLVLGLVVGSVILGLVAVLRPSLLAALLLVVLGAGTCWGVARRFTRSSLRRVTLGLLVLTAATVLGLGRDQIRDERSDVAERAAVSMKAQLDDMVTTPGAVSDTRARARTAVAELRTRAQAPLVPGVTERLLAQLAVLDEVLAAADNREAAIARVDEAAKALRAVDQELGQLAKVADPPANAKALVGAAVALASEVAGALAPSGGPTGAAYTAVAELRNAASGGTAGNLRELEARARLLTARAFSAQKAGDADRAKAVSAAESAYFAAVASEEEEASLSEGFAAGGRKLASGFPIVGDEHLPLALEALGWVLLAGLALWAYRRQEARVGRGELLLNKVERSGGGDTATTERFRTYLSRNIPEPSAVPGASSALKPMTDLLTAASSTPTTWVGHLLSGAAESLKAPRGAVVHLAVLDEAKPDAPPPGKAMIGVRVSPPGASEQLQRTFVAVTLDQAMRRGAYWASAVLIQRSNRVPEWTVWSPDANEALATYYDRADTGEVPPIDALQRAVAVAPASGLLLMDLANRYSLDERLVDAFALCLRAATLYPRWPVARYRLAATATMLAGDGVSRWRAADEATRQAVVAALSDSDPCGQSLAAALSGTDLTEQRRALCAFAVDALDKKVINRRAIVAGLLRSNERPYWQSLLRTRCHVSFRAHFQMLSETATAMAQVRETSSESVSVQDDTARNPGVTWQVAYNLACIHAERARRPSAGLSVQEAEVAKALSLLELAVTRPGGYQLTKEWLESDPDLAPLRSEARFSRLAEAIAREDGQP